MSEKYRLVKGFCEDLKDVIKDQGRRKMKTTCNYISELLQTQNVDIDTSLKSELVDALHKT